MAHSSFRDCPSLAAVDEEREKEKERENVANGRRFEDEHS